MQTNPHTPRVETLGFSLLIDRSDSLHERQLRNTGRNSVMARGITGQNLVVDGGLVMN